MFLSIPPILFMTIHFVSAVLGSPSILFFVDYILRLVQSTRSPPLSVIVVQ